MGKRARTHTNVNNLKAFHFYCLQLVKKSVVCNSNPLCRNNTQRPEMKASGDQEDIKQNKLVKREWKLVER
jgi:hypothetical protein